MPLTGRSAQPQRGLCWNDFTLDPDGQYLGHAGVLMLVPDVRRLDPYYLLGVLNSRVFWFFVRQTMPTMGKGRPPAFIAPREKQGNARAVAPSPDEG